MDRKHITSGSPFEAQIGYSRAVAVDGWVFVSGTTGYDYATMEMPSDVAQQAANALATIGKALAEAGGSLDDVVQVKYILPDRATRRDDDRGPADEPRDEDRDRSGRAGQSVSETRIVRARSVPPSASRSHATITFS